MPKYSWAKESRTLYKKIKKRKIKNYKDIIEAYWSDIAKKQGIKGENYDNSKFIQSRVLFNLSNKYTKFSLGFNWILCLRCGYKYNTTIAIRSGRVIESCPKFCPCCGKGDQSYIHWIFECSTFFPC